MSEQNSRPQNSERPQRSRRPQGGPRRRRKVDYIAANHIELSTTRTQNCWNALSQNVVRSCHVV